MTNAVMVPVVGAASPTLRQATADDAEAIHELIASHLADGHLLPRTLSDITVHALAIERDDAAFGHARMTRGQLIGQLLQPRQIDAQRFEIPAGNLA